MERNANIEAQEHSTEKFKKKDVIINVIKTIFHIVALSHYTFASLFGTYTVIKNYYHENVVERFMCQHFWAFGTNWNLLFQTLFLSLSLLYDVLEWLNKHQTDFGKKLQYYRDVTFSGLVVPFTLFISIMFWTVYTIDRELVFPQVYDQIVPWWFNHCVHTNITIVVLVETVLQARRYPRDMKVELALVTLVDVGYAIVYYTIYFLTNRWLYGIFGIMTWWQVCLYQLLIWVSAFVFYFLQFPVNRIFHREVAIEEQKSTEVAKSANGVESLTNRSSRIENSKL